MTPGLITRLQDVPGVEAVAVDLATDAGGINLRLSPDADERRVLQEVHELLVAYGVRGLVRPRVTLGHRSPSVDPEIDVVIAPIEAGARVQVSVGEIQSSRQVAANPLAIAQGLADAWSQLRGRATREVLSVDVSTTGGLTVVVTDGQTEHRGVADVGDGWSRALVSAVGAATGLLGTDGAEQADMARTAW